MASEFTKGMMVSKLEQIYVDLTLMIDQETSDETLNILDDKDLDHVKELRGRTAMLVQEIRRKEALSDLDKLVVRRREHGY